MNFSIAMRLALLASLAGAATAQAAPVAAKDDLLMGYVPHRPQQQLQRGDGSGDTLEPLYMGGFMQPLVIHVPQDQPRTLLAPRESVDALTTNSGLYEMVSSGDDEPASVGPSLSATERFSLRHRATGHGRVRVHLEDDGSSGNSGGGVTAVPLPGSLTLLGSLLALCMAGAGLLRRAAD
jgi:hypothetical protein